jgi:hypothetical protein
MMTHTKKPFSFFRWKKDLIDRLNSRSSIIETKQGLVEYTLSGNEGPVLVAIHGAPGGYDQMEEL